jgi:hypothetical protein
MRVEELIGGCAKKIVTILGRLGEVNILRLSEHLAERNVVTYQALGWLAREGRIRYLHRGSQVYISLNDSSTSQASVGK